jgi:hypothetical protein
MNNWYKSVFVLAHRYSLEVRISRNYSIIGTFTTKDGLFGRPRLAYFSSSLLGLMPAHPFGAL